jgi:branched-chain amino acid aminotransferase
MIEIAGSWFSENGVFKKTEEFRPGVFESGTIIYEVLRIQEGVALFLEDHINRLGNSIRLMGLDPVITVEQAYTLLKTIALKNGLNTGNIKIMVWYRTLAEVPLVYSFFIPHSYPAFHMYETGTDAAFFNAVRINPNVKKMHPDLIRQITDFIRSAHIYDALLVDENGYLTEGSRTNFFLVKQDKIITAPGDRVLKGITREKVLDLCKNLNIPVEEMQVRPDEMPEYDAAFFSGTSPKILPIRRIAGYGFQVKNALMQQLMAAYDKLTADYIRKNK